MLRSPGKNFVEPKVSKTPISRKPKKIKKQAFKNKKRETEVYETSLIFFTSPPKKYRNKNRRHNFFLLLRFCYSFFLFICHSHYLSLIGSLSLPSWRLKKIDPNSAHTLFQHLTSKENWIHRYRDPSSDMLLIVCSTGHSLYISWVELMRFATCDIFKVAYKVVVG